MEPLIIIFLKGAAASFGIFLVFWVVSLLIKNPSIIDVCWGLGFMAICLVFILNGAGWTLRNQVLFTAVSFWGLRIAYFVLKRLNFGKKEDHRYTKMREEGKGYVCCSFLFFYLVQATLEIVIALPFLFIATNTSDALSILDMLGALLCIGATIGETMADQQLENFRRKPESKGKVCEVGLWNYSRHPNYFFEFLIWLSFFIFALGSPLGWTSFISPIIILHLVLNVSGIKFAERLSLQSRGDAYRHYQKTTSAFVPLPKRKTT